MAELILHDAGALDAFEALGVLIGINPSAREAFDKLLDEDPVMLVTEPDPFPAVSADFCHAAMKPTKRLLGFLAAFGTMKANENPIGERNVAGLDRQHDAGSLPEGLDVMPFQRIQTTLDNLGMALSMSSVASPLLCSQA